MRSISARTTTVLAASALLPLLVAGCGPEGGSSERDAASGALQVVTSTNVYGDIVEAVGGEHVEVTAIVDSLSQDPHSYEATVQDKLAVSKADLLVENGGGYDPFLHTLADSVEMDHEYVLSAVDIAGLDAGEEPHAEDTHAEEGPHAEDTHAEDTHAEEEPHAEDTHAEEEPHAEDEHAHGSFNEHVWYNLAAMAELAGAIGDKLGALDPDNADTYEANAAGFAEELAAIEERAAALAPEAAGKAVAATEPVPAYLLETVGLEDVTPADYTEAIEEDADVPVAALNEMQELVKNGSVAFLAYNEQTEGPQTQAVRSSAESASVPVVNFTETLPDGADYLSWMSTNVDNIAEALKS
ncbi:zinc/manganese transport system substrate-binding protein [Arthrobacter subterraneus]|uniref:Zinc/manganese transport system substrate-binding protein n=1 Tax=Arthrobacter subterraneus TaxID=335973 RepID=A0A1G8FVU5_9MICC|nr:zinc ABC transporter substrate-binding protein [Arthrobacter subterraneus]SDH86279.1 zinc/manganese transport system substrate-binding protein [Arthrobacter subterraneus]